MTQFLMHENCMDVCFEILKVQYRDTVRIKYRGNWWNLGYVGNPSRIDGPRTITIKTEDRKHWKNVTDRLTVVRTKPGLP